MTWVAGIGDQLLLTVARWAAAWPRGKVAGTRPYLRRDGTMEEVVTLRAVPVAWHPKVLRYLVDILEQVKPGWYFTEQMSQLYSRIQKATLLPNGLRKVDMVCYYDELEELLRILKEFQETGGKSLAESVLDESFWNPGSGPTGQ